MACEKRDKLFDLLLEAAKANDAALHAIRTGEDKEFERLTALARLAQNTYKDCYAEFAAHERDHGCADGIASTA